MIHVRGVGGKWEHSSTRCLHILLRAARCAALTYGMPIGRRVNSRPYTSMHISAGPGVYESRKDGRPCGQGSRLHRTASYTECVSQHSLRPPTHSVGGCVTREAGAPSRPRLRTPRAAHKRRHFDHCVAGAPSSSLRCIALASSRGEGGAGR